ncbi:hypothetical protein BCR32DRAFT_245013 [Anaeromyces robustus]|uniref:Uncharacterized protein n=1 Tax=Anaeromyces robustus TaxID=1754192 RepID=A0A1Y1X6E9_9FUNG|nr:hypothetical protein BCR32DRAFT_245013 [Anaeromyces robustus]|eukprot:ORX81282.1 hypothetical protein BCR32DRAFT_245013 [Anaeromyces robustus]
MENIIDNKNESDNILLSESQNEIPKGSVNDSSINESIETSNINNSEISMENTQKPPIVEENKIESLVDNLTTTNAQPIDNNSIQENININSIPSHAEPISETTNTSTEANKTSTSSPPTPELTTRKSSRNLTKEERLRRQRELRRKKILASPNERLSRITKTYSQGSSYHDSDKDDTSSLSRKSSSRSINHYSNIERIPSDNSINKNINTSAQASETTNSQITDDLHNSNIHNLSRNSSINSLNSFSNNETFNNNNNNIDKDNNSISETVDAIPKGVETATNDTNTDNETNNKENSNSQKDDFARLLFREMLREEFNKSNNPYDQSMNAGSFGNINNMGDIKNNMDTLLTADKPFEALGKMFDFLNVDEKTSEEQKIADEKYNQYCRLSKLIHTAVIFLYSLLVVFTPWACLVLLEVSLLAGQLGYQYAFNIKKETWKEFNLIPIPIINKFISLVNQYKLYIDILMNDLFLYLFILGISVSIGKIFY